MSRFLCASCVLVGLGAWAQSSKPDEQWVAPPASALAPAPQPPPDLTAPAQQPFFNTNGPVAPGSWPTIALKTRPPEAPNRVSMFGAPALGQWKRGQSLVLGFPLLSLRLNMGLLERLDLGVGFDSFYGAMNEPRLVAKYELGGSEQFRLAVSVEGGIAFFNQRASREVRGPRWITGHRNFNVSPGVIFSFQGASPRAARLYLDVRYLLAIDTEPFATDPLNGVPSSLVLGHNVTTRFGAELPLSERTSFVCGAGLDIHGRSGDSPVMPNVVLGLVTGL